MHIQTARSKAWNSVFEKVTSLIGPTALENLDLCDVEGILANTISHIFSLNFSTHPTAAYATNDAPHWINWAGFYWLKNVTKERSSISAIQPDLIFNNSSSLKDYELVLGCFQGAHAVQRLPQPLGVCAEAQRLGKTVLVKDVSKHHSHIPCDCKTKSEIALCIKSPDKEMVIGILDIDSTIKGGLNEEDQDWLEKICELIEKFYERVAQILSPPPLSSMKDLFLHKIDKEEEEEEDLKSFTTVSSNPKSP